MKENNETLTQEQISGLFCAVNEKNITARSVLEEIEPLLRGYFHGALALSGDCIQIKMLNGQIFALKVDEV